MKKLTILFGLLALVLVGCGKDEKNEAELTKETTSVQSQTLTNEEKVLPKTNSAFINDLEGDPEKFVKAFNKYDAAHQYYFCAAFAMGAMSVVKPVTASAMVNYFLGLGVAKYQVGINDSTYEAFNAGKNVFLHESLVNTILENKTCEKIMNSATDYARDNMVDAVTIDKLGKPEVEKVVVYISNDTHKNEAK